MKHAILAVAMLLLPNVGSAQQMLTLSDLTCVGVERTPPLWMSIYADVLPMTLRRAVAGVSWLLFGHDADGPGGTPPNHVLELQEAPTLSPCTTPPDQVVQMTRPAWGGDWGAWPVIHNSAEEVPGDADNSTRAYGLTADTVDGTKLYLSWINTYSFNSMNAVARVTLNDTTHTMALDGCWTLQGQPMNRFGSGIVQPPTTFITANNLGARRLFWGLGGHYAMTAGNSYGPTFFAVAPPPNNACAAGTDYQITDYKVASLYPWNGNGPACDSSRGDLIACATDTRAPTHPYPARMAFTGYSTAYSGWDPYQGAGFATRTGFFGFGTSFVPTWYRDESKEAILVPIRQTSGRFNQKILPTPAPTISGSTATLAVASTLTGEPNGQRINVGDYVWWTSCAVGVDPGCDQENGRYLSQGTVASVNHTTGVITLNITSTDGATVGTHAPRVGGVIMLGCFYAFGAPRCSRAFFIAQTYSPQAFAAVLAGAAADSPTFTEEGDITRLLPVFGGPATGAGIDAIGYEKNLVAVISDPVAHQIRVVIAYYSGFVGRYNLIYTWAVRSGKNPGPKNLRMVG